MEHLKGANLFGQLSYNAHDNSINPIAPRQAGYEFAKYGEAAGVQPFYMIEGGALIRQKVSISVSVLRFTCRPCGRLKRITNESVLLSSPRRRIIF